MSLTKYSIFIYFFGQQGENKIEYFLLKWRQFEHIDYTCLVTILRPRSLQIPNSHSGPLIFVPAISHIFRIMVDIVESLENHTPSIYIYP